MNGNQYMDEQGGGPYPAAQADAMAVGYYPPAGYPGGMGPMPRGLTVSQEELLTLIGVDGTPDSLKSHWALAGPLARHLELINLPDTVALNDWILRIYHTLVARYLEDDWDAPEDNTFKERSYFNEMQLMLVAEALVWKSISFFGSPRERELLATYFTSSNQRIRGDEPPRSGGFWGGIMRFVGGGRGGQGGSGWR